MKRSSHNSEAAVSANDKNDASDFRIRKIPKTEYFGVTTSPVVELQSLEWPFTPVTGSETSLVLVLIPTKKLEKGRGCDLPPDRISAIEAAAASSGMNLFQALSLRRQLIRARVGSGSQFHSGTMMAMGSELGQVFSLIHGVFRDVRVLRWGRYFA